MMRKTKVFVLLVIALACIATTSMALAMSSSNYSLPWSVTSSGGGQLVSEHYMGKGLIGQPAAGQPQSEHFGLETGSPTSANNSPNAPASPLCEGVTNPAGVTDPTPEFSWTFSDPDVGDTQGAYRILVASTSENLASDNGDMWNSDKVSSSASEVSYAGTTLAQNQTYYWKVKTWDNNDTEGLYCSEQQFTTGTSPSEVWVDDSWAGSSHGAPVDGHTFGTDAFDNIQDGIDAVASPGTVHVAAGTYYENIYLKDGVEVLGTGANVTTIDGSGSGTVVTASNIGSGTKLDGFTIANGQGSGDAQGTHGGGIYLQNSSLTISNCIISGNAASFGGGISCRGSVPTLINNIIAGNSAIYQGSAIWHDGYSGAPPAIITNCTFAANGIYCWYGDIEVSNTIIWDGIYLVSSGVYLTIAYSDVKGGEGAIGGTLGTVNWGTGNIDQDPLFQAPASGNYRLKSTSPCIDAGDNTAVPGWLTTDFEGDLRIVDGDGNCVAVVDMGADEYMPLPADIRTPINPIDFGDIGVGSNSNETTTIYNDGGTCLTINNITRLSGSDEFSYVGPTTPFNITAGESQAVTIRFAPTSEGLKSATFNVNSNDPDEPDVTFDVSGNGVPPPPIEAVTEFTLDLDDDQASGGRAGITEVCDPGTGEPVEVLVGGYQAEFSYNGNIVNVLGVRLKSPFDTGASSIKNPDGLTQFNGLATEGSAAPVDLAFLTMRLIGSVDEQCQGTLVFASIIDVDGQPLEISPSEISYNFRRGDARADGEVNISDALFIAQYLAGLRDLGNGLDKVQAVNAGSVKHDSSFDEINISDVLFICQYLVGLRDGNMNLIE